MGPILCSGDSKAKRWLHFIVDNNAANAKQLPEDINKLNGKRSSIKNDINVILKFDSVCNTVDFTTMSAQKIDQKINEFKQIFKEFGVGTRKYLENEKKAKRDEIPSCIEYINTKYTKTARSDSTQILLEIAKRAIDINVTYNILEPYQPYHQLTEKLNEAIKLKGTRIRDSVLDSKIAKSILSVYLDMCNKAKQCEEQKIIAPTEPKTPIHILNKQYLPKDTYYWDDNGQTYYFFCDEALTKTPDEITSDLLICSLHNSAHHASRPTLIRTYKSPDDETTNLLSVNFEHLVYFQMPTYITIAGQRFKLQEVKLKNMDDKTTDTGKTLDCYVGIPSELFSHFIKEYNIMADKCIVLGN